MPDILHFRYPESDRQLPAALPLALPGDPFSEDRRWHFQSPAQDCVAGTAQAPGADLALRDFPWVELSLIEAGELLIEGDDYQLTLGPGDILVVPRGAQLRWRHTAPLKRVCLAFPGRASEGPMPARAVKIDPDAELAPSAAPAAEVLLSPTPSARNCTQFASGGCLRIGIWECTPYRRRQVEPGYSEFMYFYDGGVQFDTADGRRHAVEAGEAILIPAGASNAWDNPQTVRKLFCILSG